MADLKLYNNNRYSVEPLYQWDINQVLRIYGLSLPSDPEIHFSNETMNGFIVKQGTRNDAGIITVDIPNSFLQKPYTMTITVNIYKGETYETIVIFKVPIKPRKRPLDYTIEDSDEEIYSFNEFKNELHETKKAIEQTTTAAVDVVNNKCNETLAKLSQKHTNAVNELNQKYDEAVESINRLGDERLEELTTAFDERVAEVEAEIKGDMGTTLENMITDLIVTIKNISIAPSAWSNKTYTITSDLIKEDSIIDIYYSSTSKSLMTDAEPSYIVSVGKIVISVVTVPTSTVVIDCVKVVNDI